MRNVRENWIREMGIFPTEEEIERIRRTKRIFMFISVVVFSILYYVFLNCMLQLINYFLENK